MNDKSDNRAATSPPLFAAIELFIQRYRIPLVVLIGMLTPFARYVFDWIFEPDTVDSQLSAMVVSIVQVSLQLLVLVAICWPWTDHSVAKRVARTWAITFFFAASVNVLLRAGLDSRMLPWFFPVFPVVGGLVFGILAWVLLSGATVIRMRYWPLYPSGHCAHCGYNLTGNVSGACPECGTAFTGDSDQA